MILDRTWNKKEQKLTISYIDKEGNRQFLSKYLRYIKGYEYDKDGEFDFITYENSPIEVELKIRKKCVKIENQ